MALLFKKISFPNFIIRIIIKSIGKMHIVILKAELLVLISFKSLTNVLLYGPKIKYIITVKIIANINDSITLLILFF